MKLIPEEWSIGVISQFLSGSVRLSLHRSRNTKILRSVARGENIKASVYCKFNSCTTWLTFSHFFQNEDTLWCLSCRACITLAWHALCRAKNISRCWVWFKQHVAWQTQLWSEVVRHGIRLGERDIQSISRPNMNALREPRIRKSGKSHASQVVICFLSVWIWWLNTQRFRISMSALYQYMNSFVMINLETKMHRCFQKLR